MQVRLLPHSSSQLTLQQQQQQQLAAAVALQFKGSAAAARAPRASLLLPHQALVNPITGAPCSTSRRFVRGSRGLCTDWQQWLGGIYRQCVIYIGYQCNRAGDGALGQQAAAGLRPLLEASYTAAAERTWLQM